MSTSWTGQSGQDNVKQIIQRPQYNAIKHSYKSILLVRILSGVVRTGGVPPLLEPLRPAPPPLSPGPGLDLRLPLGVCPALARPLAFALIVLV